MRFLGFGLLLGLLPLNAATHNAYAIVVSTTTGADAGWKQVVASLQARHPHAVVVTWKDSPLEARAPLTKLQPHFVAWVATPAEAGRNFVTQCHRLARQLDGDPWPDCRWGIITGRDAASAQRQLTGPTHVRPQVAL
jgi:zinc protease